MKTFSGFPPGRTPIVGLPSSAFTELIPLVDDLAELKLTLHVLWRLGQQQGRMCYLRHEDLASDEVLLSSLAETPGDEGPTRILESALSRAVERGTLLRVQPPKAGTGRGDTLYFANTPKGRAGADAISRGAPPDEVERRDSPNIFTLYEQNIGMLAPLIAEELREAEQTFPAAWIEEAFREAVRLNKRSWKYIHAILQRWHTEGKGERRDTERRRDIDGDYSEYIKY